MVRLLHLFYPIVTYQQWYTDNNIMDFLAISSTSNVSMIELYDARVPFIDHFERCPVSHPIESPIDTSIQQSIDNKSD